MSPAVPQNLTGLSAEHRAKVRACLDLLQDAQSLVDSAAQELCPVPGFADEWSKLAAPYEAVKTAWYLVENRQRVMRDRAERGCCPACGVKLRDAAAAKCRTCDFRLPTSDL